MTPSTIAVEQTRTDVPAAFQPYLRPTEYVSDLAREVQAQLSVSRIQRRLAFGSAHRTDDLFAEHPADVDVRVEAIEPQDIARLIQGLTIVVQGVTWSTASLAAHGDLPIEHWQTIVQGVHALRLVRTQASPPDHPSRRFAELEARLAEPWALGARLMLLWARPTSLHLDALRERLHLKTIDVQGFISQICQDPIEWIDLLSTFDQRNPLFRDGVCDWERSGSTGTQIAERELLPTSEFLAIHLGRMLPPIQEPGITVLWPTATLDDVVLEPAVAAQVGALSLQRPKGPAALGVLLYGPSGTGKTLLAQALAHRAGAQIAVMDPSLVHRFDAAGTVSRFHLLVRRCAVNGIFLFIDEADHFLSDNPLVTRLLLEEMETCQLVIMLATNRPELLDPAFDRRLAVKLHLGIPPSRERACILARELARQAVPGWQRLQHAPAILRLAQVHRLSGGFWRNVVRLALMEAELARVEVTDAHLIRATRRTCHGQGRHMEGQDIVWYDDPGAISQEFVEGARRASILQLAGALMLWRDQHAEQVSGLVLLALGPEDELVVAAAAILADVTGLPLAGLRAGRAGPIAKDTHAHRDPDASSLDALFSALGEQAIMVMATDGDTLPAWTAFIRRIPSTRHIVILQLRSGACPLDIQQLVAVEVPWAACDEATRIHAWQRLGGSGPPPRVRYLAGLGVAIAREALGGAPIAPGATLP